MLIESGPATKYAVLTTACRGSAVGVAHRVRHEVPSCECTLRASVGKGSMHWSVRRTRAPAMTSSPPLPVTVTGPPGTAVPDTGGGPQAELHCCTVKLSETDVMFQAPS